jgi:acyl carrier protein
MTALNEQTDCGQADWSESAESNLRQVVADALGISPAEINDQTSYSRTPQWDSLAHVRLASALEEAFAVQFELDEFAEIVSLPAIRRTLIRHGAGAGAVTVAS